MTYPLPGNGRGRGRLRFTLDVDKARELIEKNSGNIAVCAKACGICRNTFWRYVRDHPELVEALEQARETMLDNVESSLYHSALAGEGWAVKYFLMTQGASRGYRIKTGIEHSGSVGGDFVLRFEGVHDPYEDEDDGDDEE